MLVLKSEISGKTASKRSVNVTWSDCSGVFITPHHILTTNSCAKLVKKYHLSSGEVQEISEIFIRSQPAKADGRYKIFTCTLLLDIFQKRNIRISND